MKKIMVVILFIFLINIFSLYSADREISLSLKEDEAVRYAEMALRCVGKEYPNKLSHVMNSKAEVLPPSTLHPCFYGCFDWHSSVHGHWLLIRLLKKFPKIKIATKIRKAINKNITKENIIKEVEYLKQNNRKSFERTYGWAWLLKLSEELKGWNDIDGERWSLYLKPLELEIVRRYQNFLPKQVYPIRTGVHPNTAFGLAFALDYARKVRNKDFERLLLKKSEEYFLKDKNCPAEWEPGGEDFFSPCLMEASLMSRVLPADKFEKWLRTFLLDEKGVFPESLSTIAKVIDRTDGKLVHLDGLNLSRAWCFEKISKSIKNNSDLKNLFRKLAIKHLSSGIKNIRSGDYAGEHWLASFAVFAMTY